MFWAQRRAKKINDEKNFHDAVFMPPAEETWMRGMFNTMKEMDVIGLVLITTSLSLVLLPLTLANTADKGWQNPVMPGLVNRLFVCAVDRGCELTMLRLITGHLWRPFVSHLLLVRMHVPREPYHSVQISSEPVHPRCLPDRWVTDNEDRIDGRTWILIHIVLSRSVCIGFFDFVSFYLQFTNLYNFIYVTQDWSPRNLSYFASIQTMAMTIFGIIGGAIMSRTREVKVSGDVRGSIAIGPRSDSSRHA